MNDANKDRLTPQGEARRDAMLGELLEVMSQAHRARRNRRRVLATAGCAALLLVIGRLALPFLGPQRAATPQFVEHAPTPAGAPDDVPLPRSYATVTVRVQTDHTIVDRCRATPSGAVVRMNDAALIETLASIHRPAGLIRFGDRVALSAPVTDAELGIKQ